MNEDRLEVGGASIGRGDRLRIKEKGGGGGFTVSGAPAQRKWGRGQQRVK